MGEKEYTAERLKYLTLLAEGYPTVQALCTEIVNLEEMCIRDSPGGERRRDGGFR